MQIDDDDNIVIVLNDGDLQLQHKDHSDLQSPLRSITVSHLYYFNRTNGLLGRATRSREHYDGWSPPNLHHQRQSAGYSR